MRSREEEVERYGGDVSQGLANAADAPSCWKNSKKGNKVLATITYGEQFMMPPACEEGAAN